MPFDRTQFPKIADYGIIGDCRSAAAVSKFGSIEWLCWPRFDSPSIFAALLDREKGGYWSLAPAGSYTSEQRYIHNSNVLQTHFSSSSGEAVLTDLMPVASEEFKRRHIQPDHEIIRELSCIEGEMQFEFDFQPRAFYGRDAIRMRNVGALGFQMSVGRGSYWLRSTIPIQPQEHGAKFAVTLKQGDLLHFSFTYSEEAPTVLPALGNWTRLAIDRSVLWWNDWAKRCKYHGEYEEIVIRSALALKLLVYAPSGAVVAAATTSLPERIGDSLNWDYRFCWLRDSALTIRALIGLGYHEEAQAFLTWLLHTTSLTQPQLRVLYTVFGRLGPGEKEINFLTGYKNSHPVRIGNGARGQLQLDIYGQVIESTAQYAEFLGGFDRTTQRVLIGIGKYVAENWDQPDEGIWEPRTGRQNHTHSRLMCWMALDRLLALSDKGKLSGAPKDLFTRERDRIRQQIESRAWNNQMQSYVSTLDGDRFDATLLRLSWYAFEHADSKRMKQTYTAVCRHLSPKAPLLYRYERDPQEGAFGVCGFWGVEHLALGGGTLDQAHAAFQQLAGYRNELGLFAEEIDPQNGEALGNLPQAFTHVGLISAALTIDEREKGQSHPATKIGSDVKPARKKERP